MRYHKFISGPIVGFPAFRLASRTRGATVRENRPFFSRVWERTQASRSFRVKLSLDGRKGTHRNLRHAEVRSLPPRPLVERPEPRSAEVRMHFGSAWCDAVCRNASLEIWPVGLRNRRNVVVEKVQIVLCADHFRHWSVGYAPPALNRRPRRVEGAGIIDGDNRLKRPAAFDHLEALDHMDLLGVGRAVIVHKSPVVEADRVDHEFVSLVMADRFAIP